MSPTLPSLFVPHGAPTFALAPGAAGEALRRIAAELPPPKAIIIASPHWETAVPTVGFAETLDTIHDFHGFPAKLYDIRYPARGDTQAAAAVAGAIAAAGLPVAQDARRGLDHGAWVPLRLMYPAASVPLVPLSVPTHGGPRLLWQLGRALAPLREQGFLIVGSGSVTHNLRDFQLAWRDGRTPDYVQVFADWLAAQAEAGDLEALLDYRQRAPDAARAHPSEEHLLPFHFALGAGGDKASARRFHAGIDDYVIAMDGYAFS